MALAPGSLVVLYRDGTVECGSGSDQEPVGADHDTGRPVKAISWSRAGASSGTGCGSANRPVRG